MTWNILNGGGDRLPAIVKVVEEETPDLLLLQELRGFPRRMPDLAAALGMVPHLARSGFGQPVAVLVRPPVRFLRTSSVTWRLHHAAAVTVVDPGPLGGRSGAAGPSAAPGAPAPAAAPAAPGAPAPAGVSASGAPAAPGASSVSSARAGSDASTAPAGPLTVISTHLNPHNPHRRMREARWLAARYFSDHTLIAGDLNGLDPHTDQTATLAALAPMYRRRHERSDGTPDTRALSAFESAGFTDLARTAGVGDLRTVPTRGLVGKEFAATRLDYVLAGPALAARAHNLRVIRTDATDSASDHYPVCVDFSL